MAHTYANLNTFKEYLADGANVGGGTAVMLDILEGASRRVEAFCDRSSFESGFGPRIGTNRYDHDGTDTVDLRDDALTITVSMLDATGGGTIALTENTDFYTRPYDRDPATELVFTGLGQSASRGLRVISAAGTFGYSNVTVSLGTAGTVSSSATTLSTNGTPYPGMTLVIDSEHLYVTATSGGTATVVRGQNGTTAAVHADGAAVSYFTYPEDVVSAVLQVAQRRWKNRETGLAGDFGGGVNIPVVAARDTERSILNATVGHLKKYAVG